MCNQDLTPILQHTFKSRNIVLPCCDLQVLCDCLLEPAKGLFDSCSLVDTVDGGGLKLMGLTEGLKSCCEASTV